MPTSVVLGLALLSAASVVGQSGDRTGVLRGVVHDSLISRAPLAGAEVWVEGTNHTARTDTRGRFEVSALAAGRYTVTFYHAVLDSLGLSAPATIVDIAAGEPTNAVLATPGPEAAHRSLCPQDPWRATGAVLGMVRDATDGRPLGNVTVTAHWAVYVVAQGPIRSEPREAGHAGARRRRDLHGGTVQRVAGPGVRCPGTRREPGGHPPQLSWQRGAVSRRP